MRADVHRTLECAIRLQCYRLFTSIRVTPELFYGGLKHKKGVVIRPTGYLPLIKDEPGSPGVCSRLMSCGNGRVAG